MPGNPITRDIATYLSARMRKIKRSKHKRLTVIEPRPNGRWGKHYVLKGIRP